MTFAVPRCPNPECKLHNEPDRSKTVRWGYFTTRCRTGREQRYRCKQCRKTFSRQTFRHDYRDRRPDCNARLYEILTSGVGLRQAARTLKICVSTAQKKFRKLAATCEDLHKNLCPRLPSGRTYLMDEEETYEQASIRPLTVPIVIEKATWFVVAVGVGSIRRLAAPGTARRGRQDREERSGGLRPDLGRETVKAALDELKRCAPGKLELLTDEKSSYRVLVREIFDGEAAHVTTAGSAPRTTRNPLFPINTTIAMTRDNNGRLRRKSWLVSKLAERLRCQLSIFRVYRNYTRRRFNYDKEHESPAALLGLLPRHLRPSEVVTWRQDWAERSVHPMSLCGARSVTEEAPM